MDIMVFIFGFFVICAVWFFITHIWAGGIDLLVAGIKKLLGLDRKKNMKNWHALDDEADDETDKE